VSLAHCFNDVTPVNYVEVMVGNEDDIEFRLRAIHMKPDVVLAEMMGG